MTHCDKNTLSLRQRDLARGMNLPMGWFFGLLLLMMCALIGHAVWRINALDGQMRVIVESFNRKIQLATDLQEAAYNRHSSLVYQTLATDPFARDDGFQVFIKWGYEVGKARNELKAMRLDDFERANLARQDKLVAKIMLVQEEITDLASREEIARAHAIMARDLRPLNLAFTNVVEELRRYERDRIRTALLATQAATQDAIRLHLALGGVSLLLAGFTGLATRKLLVRHAQTICKQMSALEEAGIRLEHQAFHDPLTGLANRALFQRRMAEGLEYARQDGFQVGVIYLDLDGFKEINDVHGHATGDALLQEVAQRLRHTVRAADTVARLGGDEFAIIVMGIAGADQCREILHKIEQAIARPAVLEGVPITPAGSLGCVMFPQDGQTMEELLKAADERMYARKRARKTGA